MSGFGSGGFGGMGFGGGAPPLQALRVFASRENIVCVQFSEAIYFSSILDMHDASNPAFFVVTPNIGTTGRDGVDVRPVSVVATQLTSADDVALLPPLSTGHVNVYGEVLDLILDRPMSAEPAQYTLTMDATQVMAVTTHLLDPAYSVQTFTALFKRILEPNFTPTRARDIANPTTRDAMFDPLPNPDNALNLGTMTTGDDGDYSFDEGVTAYKKRVLRRLMSTKNGFVHLVGYGVGLRDQSKKLMQTHVLQSILDESEKQIMQEPETLKVKVRIIPSDTVPGLVRLNVVAKMKSGAFARMDLPINTL